MYTAAQLRLIARSHRQRALEATHPATRNLQVAMAREFERDAEIALRDERREAFRAKTGRANESGLAFMRDLAA